MWQLVRQMVETARRSKQMPLMPRENRSLLGPSPKSNQSHFFLTFYFRFNIKVCCCMRSVRSVTSGGKTDATLIWRIEGLWHVGMGDKHSTTLMGENLACLQEKELFI
ncbi:hypothetical protein HanPI659440_Chr14g0561541 [Helianthus annuus]|nr:hypothetical protein HanPI659440_Chr14g0561541 [Helianthus annuus]